MNKAPRTITNTLLLIYITTLTPGCAITSLFKRTHGNSLFGKDYAEKLAAKYFSDAESLSKTVQEINNQTSIALQKVDKGEATGLAEAKNYRDALLYDMLTISDSLYGEFKDRIFSGKASLDTAAKVLDLALTGTAVAVGDKGTKTALAAAATFLGGSKLAIDENFYAKQTTTSLIAIMDGRRAEVKARLLAGMDKTPKDFTLSQGLSLVQEYHRAGSMVDAVVEINRISSTQAQGQIQALRTKEAVK